MKIRFPSRKNQTLIFKSHHSEKTIPRTVQCCAPTFDLKGKSVAVIGLGKSGRAATKLALARGASVIAIDQNENLSLLELNPLFEKHGHLKTVLGHFDTKLLKDADMVVVSPGVPLESHGLSFLLQSILSHLGIEVFVGGNLGIPLSEAAIQCLTCPSPKPVFQVAVVEVSSYQLEVPNKHFCPSVAVVLNLTSDHLERHKTMKNYAITKCRLLSHMTNSKLGILPFGNKLLNEAMEELVNEVNLAWIGAFPGVKVDMEEKVASLRVPAIGVVSELKLGALNVMGTHNYYNAAVAALSVLGLDMGIDTEAISSTIEKLRVPPHRMQIVHKDSYGVTWIDDSKATNVEATYTGLLGLNEQKSVILLGGLAKVSNSQEPNGFEQLVEPLKYHRCVITFGFSGPLIQKTLSDNGLSIPCFEAANLEDAVNCARSVARYGDAVVLSPGCASFDEFRNFEHRGKVFQELVFSSE
ncbi:UDP-N-acetylmuramoylalanine--D-glutamate ligase-like isoform X4 [Vitis riparia]|uniref:UDP-N-acetylmuramoylalanine--D-glutamate ligase-like isoform X4 n=1 Tax=Vitis riparia TaxID=96939 RepID=UPI00155A8097|nr:UDP-N-acetylmuramoylalanine--D-glutamate ligase-like isoform X4 [Vitis riparia]